MAMWLAASRPFTAFVTAHHTKIRKKLRTTRDTESLLDLRLELETAYLLSRERTLRAVYEPQHRAHGRSPDLEVTFTTSSVFMIEVTRLRAAASGTPSLPGDRFTDMVCGKLGQLLPRRSNLLLVGVEVAPQPQFDLRAALLHLQQRAEANDPTILQRSGLHDRAAFFQHYQRLSAILMRGVPLREDEPVILWVNPQAKAPLPGKVRTALLRSHTV